MDFIRLLKGSQVSQVIPPRIQKVFYNQSKPRRHEGFFGLIYIQSIHKKTTIGRKKLDKKGIATNQLFERVPWAHPLSRTESIWLHSDSLSRPHQPAQWKYNQLHAKHETFN
jgi:hypothetical protein